MKKYIALLLAVINMLLICGCSGSSDSAIIYYGVKTPPTTVDPQLASTVTELTLVKNLYEGLVREDANGNIIPAVAESFEKNGTTYTFKISDNSVWSNGDAVTADDFVFAFTRALDPATKSPEASSLYSIKNARKYNEGTAVNPSVTAADNRTLIIELEYDDPDFLSILTTPVCMPCNRKFFEKSTGKYGMSADTVLSNGSFKLSKWATEDFAMRLYKSNAYKGKFTANATAIFLSYEAKATVLERILDGSVDIAEIESSEITKAKQSGLSTVYMPNTIWLLNIGNGYSEKLKNALVYSLITYNTAVTDYPEGINPAFNLYPEFFEANEKIDIYNLGYAKSSYATEIKKFQNSALPTNTMYYYNNGNISEAIKMIAGHWQQNLGAYINIEALNSNNAVKLKQGDYSLTVYCEQINSADLIKYAGFFHTINTANLKAEILNGNTYPIAYSGSVIAYTNSLQNIITDSTINIIDFSFTNKKH